MKLIVLSAVFVFACVAPSFAQGERGWLDVNFGVAVAAEDTYATTGSRRVFGENATFASAYVFPKGASFDIGGGYMVSRVLGLGVNLQGTAHQGVPGLSIRIPHPVFFNAFATDAAPGDSAVDRAEGSVNLQAMAVLTPNSERLRVRVFGGPTYFRVTQDTVDEIRYNQVFLVLSPVNAVDITTYEYSEKEGTGWGFHGGADVGYFFNRVVGVGGFARFSRGTVELSDISGASDVTAGGFQTGGGLRLKF